MAHRAAPVGASLPTIVLTVLGGSRNRRGAWFRSDAPTGPPPGARRPDDAAESSTASAGEAPGVVGGAGSLHAAHHPLLSSAINAGSRGSGRKEASQLRPPRRLSRRPERVRHGAREKGATEDQGSGQVERARQIHECGQKRYWSNQSRTRRRRPAATPPTASERKVTPAPTLHCLIRHRPGGTRP